MNLDLPICPICEAAGSLSRREMELSGRLYTWYECAACGSALLWAGDDRWVYQKIGLEEMAHLLKQPMTVEELVGLLPVTEEAAEQVSVEKDPSPGQEEEDSTSVLEEAPSPREGKVYYEGERAKVTNLEVVLGAKTLAVRNIALARAVKSTNLATGVVIAVLGLLIGGGGAVLGSGEGVECWAAFGGAIFLIGAPVAVFGARDWWVFIETTRGKKRRVFTTTEEEALAVTEAINRAIEDRQSR